MMWVISVITKLASAIFAIWLVYSDLELILCGNGGSTLFCAFVIACPNRWILKSRLRAQLYLVAYGLVFTGYIVSLLQNLDGRNSGDIGLFWAFLLPFVPGLSLLTAWMDNRSIRTPTPSSSRATEQQQTDGSPAVAVSEIMAAMNSGDLTERAWAEAEMRRSQPVQSDDSESEDAPVGEEPDGVEVQVGFFPLAFLFAFCTPTIEIDGMTTEASWGTQFLELSPGIHTVTIFFAYPLMPRCGANTIQVSIERGQKCRVVYFMPPWVFAKGSIRSDSEVKHSAEKTTVSSALYDEMRNKTAEELRWIRKANRSHEVAAILDRILKERSDV